MSSRLLITGAGGWLGKRLTRLLTTQSVSLPALQNVLSSVSLRVMLLPCESSADFDKLGVEVFRGDVRGRSDCAKFCRDASGATLIHAAGVIHPQRVKDFYEVNRDGTRNLLEAAASAAIKRTVVVSSNSPLGLNPDENPRFNELSPYHPYMNYGRSKMEMELLVKKCQESGKIETVI